MQFPRGFGRQGIALGVVAAGLACAAGCAAVSSASTPTPTPTPTTPVAESVTVRSEWRGLSPDGPFLSELSLQRHGDHFELSGSDSRGRRRAPFAQAQVPLADVDRLVDALRAAPQSAVAVADLGIADREIQAVVDDLMVVFRPLVYHPLQMAKVHALRESLRQPAGLSGLLTQGLASASHTDDYPRVEVEVTLTGGTRLHASSGSQQYRMLPWTVAGADTYSPAVADALWHLLPPGATNRDRLRAHPIDRTRLEGLIAAALADSLQRLEAEAQGAEAP